MNNPAASGTGQPFKLSSLTLSVYIPTILFSIGQGAVIPIIPLFARELGSSLAAASLIVALRGIGQMVFDLPAGVAVSKWGDKGAMVAGTAMVAIVAVGASFSSSPIMLGVLVFVLGGGWAFWQLARLAYVSELAPVHQRGKALSMLGGMNRVGNFIGPAIGGFLGHEFGLETAFYAQALFGVAASALMFIVVRQGSGSEEIAGRDIGKRLVSTFVDHRKVFFTAGPPSIALTMVRNVRQVFIPLWGESIGLDVSQIGLITSISFFADAAVFYPSGIVMDTWGRKWSAVPCLTTIGLGFVAMPFTTEFYSFAVVAILMGIGNGFGAGINMTLGADFAPAVGRGEFLGAWRVIADLGGSAGPIVTGVLTGIGSLTIASFAASGIGFAGALIMLFFVPETLKKVSKARPKDK